jgi:hypothetical protein
VPKGLQVDPMYDPISKLKNMPVTKSLGPLSYKKWFETIKKQFFMLFLATLGPFGYPQWTKKGTQSPAKRRDVWPNV